MLLFGWKSHPIDPVHHEALVSCFEPHDGALAKHRVAILNVLPGVPSPRVIPDDQNPVANGGWKRQRRAPLLHRFLAAHSESPSS